MNFLWWYLIVYFIGIFIAPFVSVFFMDSADDGLLEVVALLWPLFFLVGIVYLALLPAIKLSQFIARIVNK